jgi:ADP-ribose pyrophosphatase YjhB (NUDIX family)
MEIKAPSSIAGLNIQGEAATLEVARLKWRPSAYALIFNDAGEMLVLDNCRNRRYDLVGGGIEIWETAEIALVREAWEETGLEICIDGFVHLSEQFFQTPMNNHWHVLSMFYRARVVSGTMRGTIIEDEESINPHWIDPKSLKPEDFTIQAVWAALAKLRG